MNPTNPSFLDDSAPHNPNNPNNPKNFWKFVDGFVQSPQALQNFCTQEGYSLLDKIGGGGFGSVYQVQSLYTGRKLALKILDSVPRHPGIIPRWYTKNGQIYGHLQVEITASLRQFLETQKVAVAAERLLPFFITSELEWGESDEIFWERWAYPRLAAYLMPHLASIFHSTERFLPGILETWMASQLIAELWDKLTIWELLQLAPSLAKQELWVWQENRGWYKHTAAQEFLPIALQLPLGNLLSQLRTLMPHHKQSLLAELLHDPQSHHDDQAVTDPYWRADWLGAKWEEELLATSPQQMVRLNVIWERYSLAEIERRLPGFFQLQITRRLPAPAAMPYLSGDMKEEVKRLAWMQREVVMANAARQLFSGINAPVTTPSPLGNNIVILSPLLCEPEAVLGKRLTITSDDYQDGEAKKRTLIAVPAVIHFLWFMGEMLKNNAWEPGDIKESNFKMNWAGEWQLIDYGGHHLQFLGEQGGDEIIGSNDYASRALFLAMNAGVANAVSPEIVAQAHSKNSRWFSTIKAAVRMLSGKIADSLRGQELNQTLARDFDGYQKTVLTRLVAAVLEDKSSPCHFSHFGLSDADVVHLFAAHDNPGLETAVRRLLFILGLTLTGDYLWSLLDSKMRDRISLHSKPSLQSHSCCLVISQWDKIVLTECCGGSNHPARPSLHPGEARKLLKIMFPGLEESFKEQDRQTQERKKILETLRWLGIPALDRFFTTPDLDRFDENLKECLNWLCETPWLDSAILHKIFEKRTKLRLVPRTTQQAISCDTADSLRHDLIFLMQTSPLPLPLIQRLLDQFVVWEKICFQEYLLGDISQDVSSTWETARAQALFLDRYTLLQTAWDNRLPELVQAAVSEKLIEAPTVEAIAQNLTHAKACNREEEVMALLFKELLRAKEYVASDPQVWGRGWQQCRQLLEKKLGSHPFWPQFSNAWSPELLQASLFGPESENGCLQLFTPEERQRWHQAEKMKLFVHDFPAAAWASSWEFVNLFAGLTTRLWQKIITIFPGISSEVPQNFAEVEQFNQLYAARLFQSLDEPDRFIYDDLWCELEQTLHDFPQTPLAATMRLYELAVCLERRLTSLQQCAAGHFLLWGSDLAGDILSFLHERLVQFLPEMSRTPEDYLLLQELAQAATLCNSKSLGQRYARYSWACQLLPHIEARLCTKTGAHAPGMIRPQPDIPEASGVTGHAQATISVVAENFWPGSLQSWTGDCLVTQVARFLGERSEDGFVATDEERQGIVSLLTAFYEEKGFILATLPKEAAVASLYKLLSKETQEFTQIPPALSDIQKLAAYQLLPDEAERLRREFLTLIPSEVQLPSFTRSVLREFLENQIEISIHTEDHNPQQENRQIRKRILVKQLSREIEELSLKLPQLQTRYPTYLRRAHNLSLLRQDAESHKLYDEANTQWRLMVQIFEDYLATARRVIEEEKKNVRWEWKEWLKDTSNMFLQNLYPELQDAKLRDIYLLIFDLSPLPPLAKVKEFMKQCRHLEINVEHQQKCKAMLSDRTIPGPVCFLNTAAYLEKSCWSQAEEEIREKLSQSQIETGAKSKLWSDYLNARSKLPVTRRIEKNSTISDYLSQESDAARLAHRVSLEIWLTRFQQVVAPGIVQYFAAYFQSQSLEKQEEIYQVLERRQTSDYPALFSWIFQEHLFLPRLQALEQRNFYRKTCDEIAAILSQRYSQVPLDLEFTLLKVMDEKLTEGWNGQKILDHLRSLIA